MKTNNNNNNNILENICNEFPNIEKQYVVKFINCFQVDHKINNNTKIVHKQQKNKDYVLLEKLYRLELYVADFEKFHVYARCHYDEKSNTLYIKNFGVEFKRKDDLSLGLNDEH